MGGFIYYVAEETRSYSSWKTRLSLKVRLLSEMVVAKT